MRVRVTAAHELTSGEIGRWEELRSGRPELASPYFHPEFVVALGDAHPATRVGVIEDGGRVAGFFPFESGRFGAGRPAGSPLSDFHALVADREAEIVPRELIRGAGLAFWEFDHLLASETMFEPHFEKLASSPYIDLAAGFDGYLEERRRAGAARLGPIQRKARKLEREVGGVELVASSKDARALDFVFSCKSQQCRRTGALDFFSALGWTAPFVRRLAETETPGFSGMLSVLNAGGRIVAAHMGMRAGGTFHWWFPVYDPGDPVAKYSPGAILLLKLTETLAGMGVTRIDLGKGDDAYKASFMSGEIAVAEGAVETRSLASALRRARIASRRWIRESPAAEPLRRARRALKASVGRAAGVS